MYITCEQCSTIFRLDEKRLKPTGSKVRCSQCGNLFVATPPAPTPSGQSVPTEAGDAIAPAVAPSPPPPLEDTFDKELDGIDLAELDSILEQDRAGDNVFLDETQRGRSDDAALDEGDELDEADLDLDFESALALDDDQAAGTGIDVSGEENDDLDLEMDFELEADGLTGVQDEPAEESLAQDDLEMNFELDENPELSDDSGQGAPAGDADDGGLGEDIELVLDDFEDVLGEPEAAEDDMPTAEEIPDEELNLDMDLELEEKPATQEPDQDQELELSLDGEADKNESSFSDDIDLSDLGSVLDDEVLPEDDQEEEKDLELSLDDDAALTLSDDSSSDDAGTLAVAEEETAATGPKDDDFDLGDFDAILEEDTEKEEQEPEDLELSLDESDGLESLDEMPLEMAGESDTAAGQTGDDLQGDDLDLGGLDSLLDEVDTDGDDAEPENIELSLDDESEQVSALEITEDSEDEKDLSDIEDLEFELDAEFEDKPVAKGPSDEQAGDDADEDEALDLSDIEKMLEDDTLVSGPGSEDAESDLSLAGGAEKWADKDSDDLGLGSDGELDLTEIEAAIDAADDDSDSGIADDLELELDLEPDDGDAQDQEDELDLQLEMEGDDSSDNDIATEDDTEEIDLSDLDLSMEDEEPETENEIIDAGDMELEFQVEDDAGPPVIDSAETMASEKTTASFGDTTVVSDSDEDLIDEAFAAPQEVIEEAEKPVRAQKKKKKKGTSKSLVFIMILALLGGGGYYGYDYIIKNDIQIPYLSDYINPKPKDPSGTAMLSTLEINSKFIENEKAGRIFVVTGKIRNGYNVPRKMIRLQGKLFTKGKVLSKTEQAFAGVVINDMDLASQDLAQIKRQLTSGAQFAGIVVNPGQTLPFMVVFSDLPADLDEFAIELLNSSPVQ